MRPVSVSHHTWEKCLSSGWVCVRERGDIICNYLYLRARLLVYPSARRVRGSAASLFIKKIRVKEHFVFAVALLCIELGHFVSASPFFSSIQVCTFFWANWFYRKKSHDRHLISKVEQFMQSGKHLFFLASYAFKPSYIWVQESHSIGVKRRWVKIFLIHLWFRLHMGNTIRAFFESEVTMWACIWITCPTGTKTD